MAEELLDLSRKMIKDAEGVLRNLRDLGEPSGRNKILHTNALGAAEDVLAAAKKMNASLEIQDAAALTGVLGDIDLSGELDFLEHDAERELEKLRGLANEFQSANINKELIKQVLDDLEAEIRQMQNDAVKKGVCLLATVARVAIPLL